MRGRTFVALGIVAGVTLGFLQCHSYGDEATATSPPDAAPDSPSSEQPDVTPPAPACAHALPPANAMKDDAPGVTKPPFWVSFDSLSFPLGADAGVRPGFDLDGTCTCFPTDHDGAAPCTTPATTRTTCDDEGGVDDSVSSTILSSFGQYIGGSAGAASSFLDVGGPTELAYISEYNGAANDPEVKVAVVRAGALLTTVGCDGGARALTPTKVANPDGGTDAITVYAPAHDGCDRYAAAPGAVIGAYPNRGPFISVPGYVVDHRLVVQLPKIVLPLGLVNVNLLEAYMTATIAPEGSSYRLDDGLLAGRIQFADLVAFIGRTQIGGTTAVCQTPFWPGLSPTLCSGRDTMASPSDEFQGKTCDSATIGTGFTAKPSQVDDAEFTLPDSTVCPGLTVDCQ